MACLFPEVLMKNRGIGMLFCNLVNKNLPKYIAKNPNANLKPKNAPRPSQHEKGLISYQDRGIKLPENGNGLVYRNMGTMENHIWSTIAKRMKHNHSSWAKKGGNNLAKILAKKCSGRLNEVAEKLRCGAFKRDVIEDLQKKET